MRVLAVVAAVLCWSSAAVADDWDEWTATDTVFQASIGALILVDYVQTKRILNDPVVYNHQESNPIMATHGNGLGVPPGVYFAAVAGTHTLAVLALPKRWRRVAQVALLGVQAYTVTDNWMAGYSLSF